MSLKDTAQAIEEYSSEYLRYVISFVDGSNLREKPATSLTDGGLAIFVGISALISTFLTHLVAHGLQLKNIDEFQVELTTRICFWVFLCMVVYFIVRSPKNDININQIASVVFHIAPVSALFASFIAFIVYSIFRSLLLVGPDWVAFFAYAVLESVFMWVYLPPRLKQIDGLTNGRRKTAVLAAMLIVVLPQLFRVVASMDVFWTVPESVQSAPVTPPSGQGAPR